jgi:hypothetical protein
MTTTLSNSIPAYSSGTLLTTSGTSSNSVIYTTGGIGTTTTHSRMTISSSGTVTLGNPYPSHQLDFHSEKIKELRVKFLDLLKETIVGGSLIDGFFLDEILEIFDTCGGWNTDIESDFIKIEELTRDKKIPRMMTSRLNDIVTEKITNTWGFDLNGVGEIFEKIDNDTESNSLAI